MRGFAEFQRENPRSDKFEVLGFDHVEFWCGDASTTCHAKASHMSFRTQRILAGVPTATMTASLVSDG